ncbi:MAG: hypothetical protein VYE73_12795 [Acidobacteriota bacterium]|nr:hypothetical protein [Acidobacteriota bacterium]
MSVASAAILIAGALAHQAAAQAYGQPVYPGYQGFLDNPDGSVTMVFQYFSHGRDPVILPAGERNRFSGHADRNQPTVFEPGNHEDVCVIVVESRQEAHQLRWFISFPDNEWSTSVDPLNAEYMLTERAAKEAQRDLDVGSAPRGVCIDKPPTVRANRLRRFAERSSGTIENLAAHVGESVRLNGQARDEGLPRGSTVEVEWSLVTGPAAADFADCGSATTTVRFASAGTYELELTATDGTASSSDRLRFEVSAE